MAGSPKQWRHPKAISEHAFDKLHVIDCTLAELDTALDSAEIIEERDLEDGTSKEFLLVVDWKRPLHVVVVVDDVRREERIVFLCRPAKPTAGQDEPSVVAAVDDFRIGVDEVEKLVGHGSIDPRRRTSATRIEKPPRG